jgi:hypothetical protein
MGPFGEAVDLLFKGATIGYAVNSFNSVYAIMSVSLASIEDEFRKDNNKSQIPSWKEQLVEKWMARNDMQNFIVLGDPGVKKEFN